MAKCEWRWVRVKTLTGPEKAVISTACENLITTVLKPRYLPEIRPTTYNYPVDLFGRWRGCKYSFIVRFRSGFPENAGEEFDAAFARLDHVEESSFETRFDIMWHRHTGQWWRLHSSVPLDGALRLIDSDEVLRPPI